MTNTLFEKIENSKAIDFGDIFNKSIELFKKVWLQGFVHLLITILVMLPLFFVMYIPIIALAGISGFENSYESYGDYGYPSEELSVGLMFLFIVLVLIMSMIASALQFGITAHFYRVCKQVDLGLPETSSYFMFLKGKYLGKVFTLAIAIFGIAILAALLCYLPILYVMVPLQLLGAIFAFNPEYSASDLIKASFKFGNKVWGVCFGLILVASILSQLVGMILCFVGVFFTASFVYLPIYFIYKDALGFEDDEFENKETLFVK
ncbi:hypothetical protein IWQ47_001523 [Aquimarina sp. EL_43]|uniref:hypothetical protein n=1 Tax=unclassified Aquimarina TaxID=2627091 RepID=UPI0018CB7883|nr:MULTISPECIES: hypothetical protein [unclassified Aquimarina]MBG6130394.1 hypothetical protein [Aquimarina sp. EL_35]MBG6149174.1 hypothetical protein [Aquimarina sp. EL_32]MBG6168452.1 hypothetical protein [Aquimarina sp. EL_43]